MRLVESTRRELEEAVALERRLGAECGVPGAEGAPRAPPPEADEAARRLAALLRSPCSWPAAGAVADAEAAVHGAARVRGSGRRRRGCGVGLGVCWVRLVWAWQRACAGAALGLGTGLRWY